MPLYEYRCLSCETRFERIQKFSDPPIEICPSCGGKVEKLLSSPAFQFKGSGWYVTDYARKGDQSADAGKEKAGKTEEKAKKDGGSSGTEAASSTSSSDSATDTGAKKDSGATPPPAKSST